MLNIWQMEWHCLHERMDRSAKDKNKAEERLWVQCDLFLGRCITCNISYSLYILYIKYIHVYRYNKCTHTTERMKQLRLCTLSMRSILSLQV